MMKKKSLTPGAIWITGLSASGKSTAGEHLYDKLKCAGYENAEILDGEELRKHLDREYGFTAEERFAVTENIVRVAVGKISAGRLVIVSTITPKVAMRQMARDRIEHFMEIYLKCPVEVCAKRDYKGNYEKALTGECDNFIGVTEPYEESEHPEMIVPTDIEGIEQCAQEIFEQVLVKFAGHDMCRAGMKEGDV